MKKYILAFIFGMSLVLMSVYAEETTTARAFIESGCKVRTGPGTNYAIVNRAISEGENFLLVEDTTYPDQNNHYDCNSDWYQVYYHGSPAYICGDHVKVVRSHSKNDVLPQSACEIELSNLGFPSSYWSGLCKVKADHPTWQFVALNTGDDWANAVNEESSCGHNLIIDSSENVAYIDRSCTAHDKNYVGMTTSGVAYYMDPRNFLSEASIFQFLHLAYDNNFELTYQNGVKAILQDAALYKYHLNNGNDLMIEINNAGKDVGMSPIFAASRMLQELGSSDSTYDL